MKIVFTRFPLESRYGGAEVQILSLMQGLATRGHGVAFLGSCPVLLNELPQRDIVNAELDIGPPPVSKWTAFSFLWRRFGMRKKLISAVSAFGKIDAIVMISLSEKLLLTDWAHTLGIRVIWIEHDSVGRWLRWNPWLPKLRGLSRFATTVCVSELSRKLYLKMGWRDEDVIAIPNGVKIERFSSPPHPQPLFQRERVAAIHIGCIARLHKEKGGDLLIEAVKDLPNISLTIVGEGPEHDHLQSLITKNRETRKPCLAGRQSGNQITILPTISDIAQFYSSIDLLILPSRSNDPFGLVAAEAMMLGIPVTVTDQCGIAGYLKSGSDALVVEAGSSRALTEAIKTLTDPKARTRTGAAGKITAQKLFSIEKMVDAYESLLTR